MRTPLGVLAKVRHAEQGLDLAPLALAGLALALVWTLVAHFALTAGTAAAFEERAVACARRTQVPRNAEPDLARTALAVGALVHCNALSFSSSSSILLLELATVNSFEKI